MLTPQLLPTEYCLQPATQHKSLRPEVTANTHNDCMHNKDLSFRYNIVVTQRAKKDMADAEKSAQKKLQQKTTLKHAADHRRKKEKQRLKMERRKMKKK